MTCPTMPRPSLLPSLPASRAHHRTCTRKSLGLLPVMYSDISEMDWRLSHVRPYNCLNGYAFVLSHGALRGNFKAHVYQGLLRNRSVSLCVYEGVCACVCVRATSAKPCQASGWCPVWGEGTQCHSERSVSLCGVRRREWARGLVSTVTVGHTPSGLASTLLKAQ